MCWASEYSLKKLTRELKRFDSKLYAKKGDGGKVLIMREFIHMKPTRIDTESYVFHPTREDFLIFALTDNWSMQGVPVTWSSLNVIKRLQEIDSWSHDVLGSVRSHNEKVQASKERDFSNNAEAFFSDNYRQFQKQFSDVNTANMDLKAADKRYQYDKRTKA